MKNTQQFGRLILVLLLMSLAHPAICDTELVFNIDFDDPAAAVVGDSGAARTYQSPVGPRLVRHGQGFAARFNGRDSVVRADGAAQLGIDRAVSVAVWVNVDARPTNEPGIVIAGTIGAFGLTCYKDGYAYWYVNGGGNNCRSPLAPGAWHHLVGTYDGNTMAFYVDGECRATKAHDKPVAVKGDILVGKRGEIDQFFAGMIDDVRIYRRALGAKEIADMYRSQASTMVSIPPRIEQGRALAGENFRLLAGDRGGVEVHIGSDVYFLDARFSTPGKTINWHALSQLDDLSNTNWDVSVSHENNSITIDAQADLYRVRRVIQPQQHRILIRDTLTSTADQDVGVLIRHHTTTRDKPVATRLCGVEATGGDSADNPTAFIAQQNSALGLVAEDDILRAQFEAATQPHQVNFGARHIGLAPGKSLTFQFAIYPLPKNTDYWDFINTLRADWNVNHTITGPQNTIILTREPYWSTFRDPQKLRQYLKRNRVKIFLLAPWLDYDHLNDRTGKLTTREEFRELMQQANRAVKAIDPEVKMIGDIEAPFVSIPDDALYPILAAMENKNQGYYELSDAAFAVLRDCPSVWEQWGDAIVWSRAGRPHVELYYRGRRPMMALTVRPQMGNGQYRYLLDQIRFIIDDVGLDGYYIDSWTGAKHWHIGYSYDKWDGVTVDIDPATGNITGRYTDLAMVAADARRELINHGLSRGKTVVTNGAPISMKSQSLGHISFNESEWVLDPTAWNDGDMPPLEQRPCNMHLFTPVSLGFRPSRYGDVNKIDYAKVIMKGAIGYLRHGLLYFHYGTELPPADQPGGGEYGPINHMYPITPVRLGPGFVEGAERVVTAVSRDFHFTSRSAPDILVFDMHGLPVQHNIVPQRAQDNTWLISMQIQDWQQIAIIERPAAD